MTLSILSDDALINAYHLAKKFKLSQEFQLILKNEVRLRQLTLATLSSLEDDLFKKNI